MAKTQYWSLNYRQDEWLNQIMMEYASYLIDLGVFDMINKILKEQMYDRTQREKLNEVADLFKRMNKRNQEALKNYPISLT
jgi:hypothetical protein